MLVRDMKAEEICQALDITNNTMQTHRRHILEKVRARGVAGLVRWWDEYQREKLASQ